MYHVINDIERYFYALNVILFDTFPQLKHYYETTQLTGATGFIDRLYSR